MTDREFLVWVAQRLVGRHGESPNVGFVQRLVSMAVTANSEVSTSMDWWRMDEAGRHLMQDVRSCQPEPEDEHEPFDSELLVSEPDPRLDRVVELLERVVAQNDEALARGPLWRDIERRATALNAAVTTPAQASTSELRGRMDAYLEFMSGGRSDGDVT